VIKNNTRDQDHDIRASTARAASEARKWGIEKYTP